MILMISVKIYIGHCCEDKVEGYYNRSYRNEELQIIVPVNILEWKSPAVSKEHEETRHGYFWKHLANEA